ncbi:MAG: metallophosphoesterase [Verrucomicrobiae bacterium]|nr:metallophosphoesterase [Verrucomicrobiae bacterium]
MSGLLHGIHLSDTHLGPSTDFEVRGSRPSERLDRILRAIDRLDFTPDFVIHTGDLVNDPDPAAYQVAAEALAPLASRVPLYVASGNHDDSAMMAASAVAMGPRTSMVKDADRLAYRFELPGMLGFVLDANVPNPAEPHGDLPENQLEALAAQLEAGHEPFAVFVHYQPFPIHSAWIDEFLPLRNGEALHALLGKFAPDRCRGVFFGHLHRSVQLYRDGILYSGIASPVCEFTAGVHDEKVEWSSDCPAVFHHLSFSPQGTVIKAFYAP